MYSTETAKADMIREISGVNTRKCMKCGKCSASCPAYDEMDIRPHQFVSYVESGDVSSLLESKSLWKCLSCFACVERCPSEAHRGGKADGGTPEKRQLFKPGRGAGAFG